MKFIEIANLRKVYRKGSVKIPALRGVSLEVERGEFISIVGRSGSGKSTLLNLVGGLDTATSGSIVVDGTDLAGMDRSGLARHRRHTVGMVFQSFNLISHRSALENVMLALTFGGVPRGERRPRATNLLRRVGLGRRLDHNPSELSGGEAQRVALARALANGPDALLLDEPTGNLDSSTAREIIDLIAGLNRDAGLTAIMVTHEQALAREVSSRIVELLDGRVVGSGEEGRAS
ncbi:MAG: ABC transporter ATP-binding protein [bacterium]